ncbi:MAG: hypothetical protein CM1200mP24_07370 [Gammaproteobacteria bacterium]|nr:MAG: hypothetical protein CM1200mP24_07370 [Gammaproteobacteria bacterium]
MPGFFVAFCVNLDLISDTLRESSGRDFFDSNTEKLRAGFLIRSCGGELLETT